MTEFHTFISVDPGIENTAISVTEIHSDGSVILLDHEESSLRVRDEDKNLSPSDILKKYKTNYICFLRLGLNSLSFKEMVHDHNKVRMSVVLEDNDNKYTRLVSPYLAAKTKYCDDVHMVKPMNVWNSLKRDMGWIKGQKTTRHQKKQMTRCYISRFLPEAQEEFSDDLNDSILNALYMAKKLGLFKKKKKKTNQ